MIVTASLRRGGSAFALVVGTIGGIAVTGPSVANAASCVPAGGTGLTTVLVAQAGQTISGQTIDATGCDVGIYVGPGTASVTIDGVTISGANDHAIFAQDSSGLTVQNSTIQGNGLKPTNGVTENKAVELDGMTGSTIQNNVVQNNYADGGIGISDDGPLAPGAPKSTDAQPVKASNNVVSGNKAPSNYGGCTIVVSAYNAGGGDDSITVTDNTVSGTPGQFGPHGPVIGQIVVANDGPGNTISNVKVSGNTVTGSALAGIVLHANAPDDVLTGTTITNNTLSANHWLAPFGPPVPTAIAVQAEAGPPGHLPVVTNTTITGNTISNEYYGIWSKGQVSGSNFAGNSITTTPGGVAIFAKPASYAGLTEVGGDGGVFTYGVSQFFGSAAGSNLPSGGVVGAAASRDNGGYWIAGADGSVWNFGDAGALGSLPGSDVMPASPVVGITATNPGGLRANGVGFYLVGADGGVFTFGDAKFFGSMGGKYLAAPIVGMAVTPDDGGYWLVAADGGVFTFGDANFFGSMGGKHLAAPVVGMDVDQTGGGYRLVASDGGVFTFGDAVFAGSAAGTGLSAPVKAIVAGPPGGSGGQSAGYWLVSTDGTVHDYGAVPPVGPSSAPKLAAPVVGAMTTN